MKSYLGTLSTNKDIIDRDMNQSNKVANEAHDSKANNSSSSQFLVFYNKIIINNDKKKLRKNSSTRRDNKPYLSSQAFDIS